MQRGQSELVMYQNSWKVKDKPEDSDEIYDVFVSIIPTSRPIPTRTRYPSHRSHPNQYSDISQAISIQYCYVNFSQYVMYLCGYAWRIVSIINIRYYKFTHKIYIMNLPISPSKSTQSLNVSHISPYQNERPFTFQSQSQQNHQNQYKFGQKDDDTDFSEEKQHLQRQYKMRIDSIIKGYEVKISREQETFQLKEMKHIQEIQYLKRQIKELSNLNRDGKSPTQQQHCSLCSNGQVTKFMKNMLEAIENDHRGCLSEKCSMTNKILTLQQKISLLESDSEEAEKRYQRLRQEYRQLKTEKQVWDRQKRQKERQFREIQRNFQVKEMTFEQESIKQQMMQKQLEAEIKKVQMQHFESINLLKQEAAKELQNQKKKLQQKLAESRKEPVREPKNGHKFDYDLSETNHENLPYKTISYPETEDICYPRIQVAPLRASLISNSHAHNRTVSTFSKYRGEQSYAEYANNKRRTRNAQKRSGIYQNKQTFDTFRPKGPYI